ncbi:MAG: heme/hemin ABC transporter substrate-binding protein [Vibrio gallaecicus]|uniref:heme/hemin ABC transporter substrate-binding protein n=1 Tax=Vibrio TaxID=662 RepID=UPI0010C967A8|nr:ABC transporter substrate-binding protein [Vibrio gallaecicus]MDN3616487.1 ABC transporter substrate-binding protein [Vibrio gallaecicus]
MNKATLFKSTLQTLAITAGLFGAVNTVSANDLANQRIISAGSAVTELVIALDATDKLVAVDVTSRFPESNALPKIGYHRQLSAEGLIALQPTVIIGSDEMGPDSAVSQLKSANVDVQIVNTEASIDGLLDRIDQIANLTGSQNKAQAVKKNVAEQVNALESNQVTKKDAKTVLFLLLHEGRPANVAGKETTPNAIIELAGGINPASTLTSFKPLSMESMVEMQPDVILVSGRSYKKMGGADAILKSLPMLAATPAGMNKQIITVDGSALVGGLGLRSLSEAKRLNALIYP